MNRALPAGLFGLVLALSPQTPAVAQDEDLNAQIQEAQAALQAAQEAAAEAQALLDTLMAQSGTESGSQDLANDPEQRPEAPAAPAIFSGWASRFELGINGSEGNTQKTSIFASLVSNRETASTRQQFDASVIFGTSDGEQDDGKATVGFRNDWLFNEKPYFVFADGRADYDRFKDFEYRVQAFLGAGYELVKEDDFTFTPLVGLGAAREFNSPDDEIRPEALLGFDLAWAITPNQDFTYDFRAFPSLDGSGEFRLTNKLAWVIKLPDFDNGDISLGLRHEFDSDVESPVRENDLFYFAAIGFDF